MVPSHSNLSFLLEECMPGPEQESNRSDMLQLLSKARARYVPSNSKQTDDDFDFDGEESSSLDLDFEDEGDDDASTSSILDDLNEMLEGNEKGDVALFQNKDKAAENIKAEPLDGHSLSFPKERVTSYKAPVRRTDFAGMALYRRSWKCKTCTFPHSRYNFKIFV